jgi:hypothetical protein
VVSRFIPAGASDLVAGSGLHFDERERHLRKGLREPLDLTSIHDTQSAATNATTGGEGQVALATR